MQMNVLAALGDSGCLNCTLLPAPPQPLSLFAVQFLNAVGDLLDLIPALGLGPRPTHGDGDRDLGWPHMGHCSALIKVRVQRDA